LRTSAPTAIIAAAPLDFTTAPVPKIAGQRSIGSTLTVLPGKWNPSATLAYQWKRNGVAIIGATATTYVLTTADAGQQVTVTVTASASGYKDTTKESAQFAAWRGIRVANRITTDTTLKYIPGQVYVVDVGQYGAGTFEEGCIVIAAGVTLTIEPGVVLKMHQSSFRIYGSLIANGTPERSITFTSIEDDSYNGDTNNDGPSSVIDDIPLGDNSAWGNFSADSDSGLVPSQPTVEFDNVKASTGGILFANNPETFKVKNSTLAGYMSVSRGSYGTSADEQFTYGAMEIVNNTISHLIRVHSGHLRNPQAQNMLVLNNKIRNESSTILEISDTNLRPSNIQGNVSTTSSNPNIQIEGILVENWSLPPISPTYFIGSSGFTIAAGATLTVPGGRALKFMGYKGLTVLGTLVADGTTTTPVTFTSRDDDTVGGDLWSDGSGGLYNSPQENDWPGISVLSGGSADLRSAVIDYAQVALRVDLESSAELHGQIGHTRTGVIAEGYVDASETYWGSSSGPAPLGTGASATGDGVWVTPWIGYKPSDEAMAPSLPESAVSWAQVKPHWRAFNDTCADVLFIGVRGSGEEYTGLKNEWIHDGFGRMIRNVRDSVASSLPTTETVRQYALDYPAKSVPSLGDDLVQAGNSVMYGLGIPESLFMTGAAAGTARLVDVLEDSIARCHGTERWILGGYSQGAMVVHEALTLVSDNSPLAGAALIADPERRPTDLPTAQMGSANGVDTIGALAFTRNIGLDDELGASAIGPMNSNYRDRVIDICDAGDPVCTGFSALTYGPPTDMPGVINRAFRNIDKHTQYGTAKSMIGAKQLSNIGDNLADSYVSLKPELRTILRLPAVAVGEILIVSMDAIDGVPHDYGFSDWQLVHDPVPTGAKAHLEWDGQLQYSGVSVGTYDALVRAETPGSLPLFFTLRIEVR
jgi:hypothetical protein